MEVAPAPLPRPRPWSIAALAAIWILFAGSVGALALARYRLYVASLDLAIYHQAVWLLANGEGSLITTRDLGIFAHHLSLLLWPVVLIYKLSPTAETLLVCQVVAALVASVPVFALARELTRSDAAALGWVAAMLAYPAVQFVLLHDFHCEPLAWPGFTAALWCAHRRAWRGYAVALLWSALAKEDAGLTIAALGAGLLLAGERRAGAWSLAAGFGYTLLAVKLVMPRFGEGDAFYFPMFYGGLGETVGEVALAPLLHPGRVASALWHWRVENLRLVLGLFIPLACLPLLKPSWALGAAATLYANLVSDFWPTHELSYHYTGHAVPLLLMAAVAGGGRLTDHLERRGVRRRVAVATPLAMLFGGTVLLPLIAPAWLAGSPTGPSRVSGQIAAWAAHRPWAESADRLLAQIPPDASVTASLVLLPKVSGRREVYRFPEPVFAMPQHSFAEAAERMPLAPDGLRAGLRYGLVDYYLLEAQARLPVPLEAETYAACLQVVEESPHLELVGDIGEIRLYRRR